MKTKVSFTIQRIANDPELALVFRRRYQNTYATIYDLNDEIVGLDEAFKDGDKWLSFSGSSEEDHKSLYSILGDWPVSDREIRALGLTLREFQIIH